MSLNLNFPATILSPPDQHHSKKEDAIMTVQELEAMYEMVRALPKEKKESFILFLNSLRDNEDSSELPFAFPPIETETSS